VKIKDKIRTRAAEMRFMRPTAKYTGMDCKANDALKEINTENVVDKILKYDRT
jgi:hypothetical protein